MPLLKVKMLDYDAAFRYAPALCDAVINTDYIVSVVPKNCPRPEKCVHIRFAVQHDQYNRHGHWMDVVGVPEDFLPKGSS